MSGPAATVDPLTNYESNAVPFDLPFGGAESNIITTKTGGSALDVYLVANTPRVYASDVVLRVYALVSNQEKLVYQRLVRAGEGGALCKVRTRADSFRVTLHPASITLSEVPGKLRTSGTLTYALWGWEPSPFAPADQGIVPYQPSVWTRVDPAQQSAPAKQVITGPCHLRQLMFNLEVTANTWVHVVDIDSAPGSYMSQNAFLRVRAKRYVANAGDAIDFDFRDPHTGVNDGLPFLAGVALMFTGVSAFPVNSNVLVGRAFSYWAEYRGQTLWGGDPTAPIF